MGPEFWVGLAAVFVSGGAVGAAGTLLAQWLYLSGLEAVEAGRATLVATFEPVVAAVLGYGVLGESLERWQIVGGLLVLSAVITVRSLGRAGTSPGAIPPYLP